MQRKYNMPIKNNIGKLLSFLDKVNRIIKK